MDTHSSCAPHQSPDDSPTPKSAVSTQPLLSDADLDLPSRANKLESARAEIHRNLKRIEVVDKHIARDKEHMIGFINEWKTDVDAKFTQSDTQSKFAARDALLAKLEGEKTTLEREIAALRDTNRDFEDSNRKWLDTQLELREERNALGEMMRGLEEEVRWLRGENRVLRVELKGVEIMLELMAYPEGVVLDRKSPAVFVAMPYHI